MASSSAGTGYEVEGVLPTGLATAFDPGTNILVSGAAMAGKRRLVLDLLARGAPAGDAAVVLTTQDPATAVVEEYQGRVGDASQEWWAVDCVGGDASDERVRSVSSPSDLTGIGIEFSEVATAVVEDDIDRVRVGFDSVSSLLMYSDLERVFRFLHVFTSQIQSRNWLGLFTFDPASHDDRVANTLHQLFDGVVDLRTPDGGTEVRLRGLDGGTSDWVPLE